jgi:hypothetical protein
VYDDRFVTETTYMRATVPEHVLLGDEESFDSRKRPMQAALIFVVLCVRQKLREMKSMHTLSAETKQEQVYSNKYARSLDIKQLCPQCCIDLH